MVNDWLPRVAKQGDSGCDIRPDFRRLDSIKFSQNARRICVKFAEKRRSAANRTFKARC
jgi:hypothetical protein